MSQAAFAFTLIRRQALNATKLFLDFDSKPQRYCEFTRSSPTVAQMDLISLAGSLTSMPMSILFPARRYRGISSRRYALDADIRQLFPRAPAAISLV